MNTTASVFRKNLTTLGKSRGFADGSKFAAALGFTGDERSWLLRIWKKGLTRPDPRRASSLKAVTTFLKVQQKELWQADLDMHSADEWWGRELFSDKSSYARQVIQAYQVLQRTRELRPFVYKKAWSNSAKWRKHL